MENETPTPSFGHSFATTHALGYNPASPYPVAHTLRPILPIRLGTVPDIVAHWMREIPSTLTTFHRIKRRDPDP